MRGEHARKIQQAYRLYRQRGRNSAPGSGKAAEFRRRYAVADVSRIHFVGVFDTVGALGIPAPFLGTLGSDRYLFHDTQPSGIINHARHAVSIDENRQDFEPSLWTPRPGLDLKQVWFAGVHSDIGGAYKNRALGDHAGHWLAQEAEACGLAFEPHFLQNLAPDYTAKQHNEFTGFYRAMRRRIVREVEPVVHVSVRRRWEDDGVRYRSPALRGLLESVGGDWGKIQVMF